MTLRGKVTIAGIMLLGATAGAGLVMNWHRLDQLAYGQALKNTSLTRVRHDALAMFPRGSRLADAGDRLAGIGFDCETLTHFLPDVSAPSLVCASNGRGYPEFPGINLTVLARNGLVADIEVWNVMARSDDGVGIDRTATGSIRTARKPILAIRP